MKMKMMRPRKRLLLAALLAAACSTTAHPGPQSSRTESPAPALTAAAPVPATVPANEQAREGEERVERVPVAEATAAEQDDSVVEVRFDRGATTLQDGSRSRLDEMYRRLLAHRSMYYLELQGHSDATGSEAANLRISEQRAETVERYLHRRRGVPLDAMGVMPLGSAAPIADNSTPEGRAENRRVTVVVVRTPAPPIVE